LPSAYPNNDQSAWIISHRPPKAAVNAFEPNGFFLERERSRSGRIVSSGTIFLTNKECPWRCLMCDLWKHTLSHSVPNGAIPRHIDYALKQMGELPEQIKLYNSGSFFDPAAIPPGEYSAIADRVSFTKHVVVESHPRLIAKSATRLRDLLEGSLEVAMGLETVHPEVLPRLNKRFTLDHFAQAATLLRKEGIDVRAFVLVQPPFLDEAEAVEWAVKSARFAFSCGANVVSLIPTRPGNGALDRLMSAGEFAPPSLRVLEESFDQSLILGSGRVFADTWDLERFSNCKSCFKARKERLDLMNLCQQLLPRISCACAHEGF